MQRRISPWLVLLALLALVCLVGCSPPLTFGPTPPQPTATVRVQFSSLHVVRTSDFPQNHIPPFEATVTNPAKIQRLFVAIEALPPAYPGDMFCPLDLGYYHLVFHSTTAPVLQVDIEAGGCQGVYFDGTRSPPEKSAASPQFWQLFAQTLGVSASTLTSVSPQPADPSAPTPSS